MTPSAPPPATPVAPPVRRFAYAVGLGGVACTLAVVLLFDVRDPVSTRDLVFTLIAVAVTASVGIDLSLRTTNRTVTMDEIGYAVALVILPPTAALLTILVGTVIEQAVQRRSPVKAVFNIGQNAISMTPAVAIVAMTGVGGGFAPSAVLTVLAAMLLNAVVNMLLFSGIVGRMSGADPLDIFRQEHTTNMVTAGAGTGIGILAAYLWVHSPALLPLLVAPALLVRTNTRARRRAAEELATERDRLHRAIEGLTDGVALVDEVGRIVLHNDSFRRLAGLAPDDPLTPLLRRLGPAVAGDDDPRVSTREGEVDGRTVRLVQHVVDTGRRGTGAVVQLQDVTRQREVEQLREDFVSRVSHELRTPLTSINGTVDTLLERGDLLGAEQRTLLLEAARRNGKRLQRLVASLLLRARIEGPSVETTQAAVHLAELVASVVEELPELEAEQDVADHLVLHADPDHLRQILENLLTNAARYGAPPVRVTAEDVGGAVELRVSDHGPGVPEDFVPLLFDPFTQASTGTRREAHGLGLGLDIVRSLVETNGGEVRYEPGSSGACFVVRLPDLAVGSARRAATSHG